MNQSRCLLAIAVVVCAAVPPLWPVPEAGRMFRAPEGGRAPAGTVVRLVNASVSLRGEVLLRTSTSDDGKPDADAVWAYWDHLRFEPTDAFAKLLENREGGPEFELTSRNNQRDIELSISYGGFVELRSLKLVPRSADHRGNTWAVDASAPKRFADNRWIKRRAAGLLDNP